MRRRASVPWKVPEPVQRAVHDPEESDSPPDGEVDAEDEREQQPGRDHKEPSRKPGPGGPAACPGLKPTGRASTLMEGCWVASRLSSFEAST